MHTDVAVFRPNAYLQDSPFTSLDEMGQAQNFVRLPVISPDSAGLAEIGAQLLVLPAGEETRPIINSAETHTIVYILRGRGTVYVGEERKTRHELAAGDFVYVPPMVVHATQNCGDDSLMALVTRTPAAGQTTMV